MSGLDRASGYSGFSLDWASDYLGFSLERASFIQGSVQIGFTVSLIPLNKKNKKTKEQEKSIKYKNYQFNITQTQELYRVRNTRHYLSIFTLKVMNLQTNAQEPDSIENVTSCLAVESQKIQKMSSQTATLINGL